MTIEQIVAKIRQLEARERSLSHSRRDRGEVRADLTQIHRELISWRSQLHGTLLGEKKRALQDSTGGTWTPARHRMVCELATIDQEVEERLRGRF